MKNTFRPTSVIAAKASYSKVIVFATSDTATGYFYRVFAFFTSGFSVLSCARKR